MTRSKGGRAAGRRPSCADVPRAVGRFGFDDGRDHRIAVEKGMRAGDGNCIAETGLDIGPDVGAPADVVEERSVLVRRRACALLPRPAQRVGAAVQLEFDRVPVRDAGNRVCLDAVHEEPAPVAAVAGNPPAEGKESRAGDGRLDNRRLAGLDHAAAEARPVRGENVRVQAPESISGVIEGENGSSAFENSRLFVGLEQGDAETSGRIDRNRNGSGGKIHRHAVRVAGQTDCMNLAGSGKRHGHGFSLAEPSGHEG